MTVQLVDVGCINHTFRTSIMSASAHYPGRHVIVSEELDTSNPCTLRGSWLALGGGRLYRGRYM